MIKMSIKVNLNNWIVISKDDPSYESMKDLLTIVEKELTVTKVYDRDLGRRRQVNKTRNVSKYLYTIQDNNLYIPFGLLKYVKYLFKNSEVINCTNKTHPLYNTSQIVDNIENYRNILPGISLYDNQLEAVKRIFQYRRGAIQAATGFGKTEIMCAAIQIMKELNGGVYPTILILEPTIELLKGIKSRFKRYKIPTNDYRETRMIMTNKVNLAHPASLCSDLEKNNKALNKIEVQFMDECHHASSQTWSMPTFHMPNLIYSIGLSATFVSHYHVEGQYIDDFNFEELRRIGTCGPIIMRVDADELVKNEQLAYPKLCIMKNNADEEMDESKIDYTWTNVRKIRLQSQTRTKLIADAACIFAKRGYKVIILMNILAWGRSILQEIYKNGYGDIARTCFGGQTYEKCNKKTGKIEKEYNSALKLFDKEKIKIIIGSSAIQEGIDLSRVDVCILAQGGKSDRTTLQSVGRALRRSKTGKYSYIVDFNDSCDKMLSRQFRERMVKYKKVLGITNPKDIIKNATPEMLEQKFKEWEDIKE